MTFVSGFSVAVALGLLVVAGLVADALVRADRALLDPPLPADPPASLGRRLRVRRHSIVPSLPTVRD